MDRERERELEGEEESDALGLNTTHACAHSHTHACSPPAAYLVPLLERLLKGAEKAEPCARPSALVVLPSRELMAQVKAPLALLLSINLFTSLSFAL